jgi:hypothetical protein
MWNLNIQMLLICISMRLHHNILHQYISFKSRILKFKKVITLRSISQIFSSIAPYKKGGKQQKCLIDDLVLHV